MKYKMPNPDKAVTVTRNARRTPDGVKSCTTNVSGLSRRELRLFRDEWSGKAPLWTYSGKCFRPVGRWRDTKAGGEYVTNNTQENNMNEKDVIEQKLLDEIVNDDELYNKWRVFRRDNAHRYPSHPGSAIRDANIEVMQEFLFFASL